MTPLAVPNRAIRVLIVAPQATVRAGLRSLLDGRREFLAAGEVPGPAAVTSIREPMDVLLIEGVVSSSLAAIDWASRRGAGVVFLGADPSDSRALASQGLRAWGWLGREAEGPEIRAAVQAVAAGLTVLSPSAVGSLPHPTNEAVPELTPRELEVLDLIADGLTNKAIALRLGVSPHTAKFHVASLLQKLGAASRAEAVSKGLRMGLVSA